MLLVSHNVQQRGHAHDGCYVNRTLSGVVWGVVRSDRAVVCLEVEFRALSVLRAGPEAVRVIIEKVAREGPCPNCGC